jgi:uncharacterized low-complexity protein
VRRRLTYANVTATLALVFAMSGGALAASHYLINSTKQINPKVLKKLKGNAGKTGRAGPQGASGPQGAAGPQGAKGAGGARGAEGPAGLSALLPLPSGQSESGDYGSAPLGTTQLVETVTFPIRLGAGIPSSNVVYTSAFVPVAHCSGPGHAEAGYLCVYSVESLHIEPPTVEAKEGTGHPGSGLFGFLMLWSVTGPSAFDFGTYTVTAP